MSARGLDPGELRARVAPLFSFRAGRGSLILSSQAKHRCASLEIQVYE